MRYTLTFSEGLFELLNKHLFKDRSIEKAAYLLCSFSNSSNEKRLIVSEVIPVEDSEIDHATKYEIVIDQKSYLRALKRANLSNKCFIFVHSHPVGCANHSLKDNEEESELFRTAYLRIHNNRLVHGSLVLSDPSLPVGRIWLKNGTTVPIGRIRVIGNRFKFYDIDQDSVLDIAAFNRQILAFGEGLQKLLGRLNIGIIGLGGTGSAVCEQLTRLGVGRLTLCDPQTFESTNVNRVYGSSLNDEEYSKTDIAKRNIVRIGIGTNVKILKGSATDLPTAQRLKECDIIFGCTDDEWGRAILTKLASFYLVPVFDMGIEIDSEEGNIKSIKGRVTALIPNSPCLFCRGIITSDILQAEILYKTKPEEYKQRIKEGYIPGLPGNAPAVITFTSSVAATAVCEMLHRFTGYMGESRNSTEVILRFDESKISTNSRNGENDCWCTDIQSWGRGDTDPFLGLTWPS